MHTVHERGNREVKDAAGLMAIAAAVEASSGKARAERGGEGDLGGPRLKTTMSIAFGAPDVEYLIEEVNDDT